MAGKSSTVSATPDQTASVVLSYGGRLTSTAVTTTSARKTSRRTVTSRRSGVSSPWEGLFRIRGLRAVDLEMKEYGCFQCTINRGTAVRSFGDPETLTPMEF